MKAVKASVGLQVTLQIQGSVGHLTITQNFVSRPTNDKKKKKKKKEMSFSPCSDTTQILIQASTHEVIIVHCNNFMIFIIIVINEASKLW